MAMQHLNGNAELGEAARLAYFAQTRGSRELSVCVRKSKLQCSHSLSIFPFGGCTIELICINLRNNDEPSSAGWQEVLATLLSNWRRCYWLG